jgi:hypothetical protein
MPEHQESDDVGKENEEHWPHVRRVSAPVWVIWSFCLFAVLIGLVAHYDVTEHSAKIKFFTEALFSFAALAVVITQAVIYSQQRDAMRQQIEIAQIAERAYMGIKDVVIVNFKSGEIPYIEVMFLNGGRTPMWNVHPPATLRLGTLPPDKFPEYPTERGGLMPAGTQRSVKYHFPRTFTDEDVAQVLSGEERIFLFGKVWFEDCWGDHRDFEFILVLRPADGKFEEYKPNHIWNK